MKKIIALVIAIVMMAAIAVPAFAETTIIADTNTPSDLTVSYTVTGSWSVSVPNSVTLGATGEGVNATVSAEGTLSEGQTLTLKLAAAENGKFELVNGTYKIPYTVKGTGEALAEGAVTALTLVAPAEETGDVTITFTAGEIPNIAGTYTQTLSFTVTIA